MRLRAIVLPRQQSALFCKKYGGATSEPALKAAWKRAKNKQISLNADSVPGSGRDFFTFLETTGFNIPAQGVVSSTYCKCDIISQLTVWVRFPGGAHIGVYAFVMDVSDGLCSLWKAILKAIFVPFIVATKTRERPSRFLD